jgi:hypothetical protein
MGTEDLMEETGMEIDYHHHLRCHCFRAAVAKVKREEVFS